MSTESTVTHTESQLLVLNKFRKRLEREKYINNYASNYYGSMQHRFTIPGILITGICSIASFLATSDMLNTDTKSGFSIGVGILTAGATILQSVSSSFGFGARKDAFQKSADSYDDLITKIEFEIYNPNESFTEFCNDLEEAILKIKNDCSFLPPLFILSKYEAELAKSHLKLDGSPSKSGSFEDMIIHKSNNNSPDSLLNSRQLHNNSCIVPNDIRINMTDTVPKISGIINDVNNLNNDKNENNYTDVFPNDNIIYKC